MTWVTETTITKTKDSKTLITTIIKDIIITTTNNTITRTKETKLLIDNITGRRKEEKEEGSQDIKVLHLLRNRNYNINILMMVVTELLMSIIRQRQQQVNHYRTLMMT